MAETTRTFIAIAVPRALGRELAGLQALLAAEIPGCRWTEGLPFHITLAFLGDVRDSDRDRLCQAVDRAVGEFEPFEVCLGGLGAFPGIARPRVIWTGVVTPNMKPLIDLREAVVDAVSELGYRPDDLRFLPHVTLGRIKPGRHGPRDLGGLVEHYQGWSTASFPIEEVNTFASTLGPGGPIHRPIGSAQLKSKKL